MEDQPIYFGKVEEVFSGDDLIVMVDLGVEGLHKRQRVRLHGVDTPNAIGESPSQDGGKIRDEIRRMSQGKRVRLSSIRKKSSSWVAVVEVVGDRAVNLNEYLIHKGYPFKRQDAQ